MRLQVSENNYRGTECTNWFVSLALNHLSFCPSHINMATNIPAGPVLVFRCKTHTAQLARGGCSYRTLRGQPFLKTRWCLHWALYHKGVIACVFRSWCVWSSRPCPGTWRLHPAPQVRAGGWGAGPCTPTDFPRFSVRRCCVSSHTVAVCAFLLLLPTQESSAASFFNPAQVRPDFPVQITIALFTFHTP